MSEYLNNAKQSLTNATDGMSQNLPDTNAISTSISDTANSFRESAKSATADFSSQGVMNASQEFLNSNSLIARFVFIVLVLILFMILLNVGVAIISYFVSPSKSPYIIHGMLAGTETTTYLQDPANSKAVVYRSNNQSGGVEFTWSMWLKVDALPYDNNYHCVFVKGTDDYTTGSDAKIKYGVSKVNNGPGVYLYRDSVKDSSSSELKMAYLMDVVSPETKMQNEPMQAIISNLPIGKWFHVAIRLQNKTMDCYVNGVIMNRVSFGDKIPKQNYDPIIYAGNGGFAGSTSNLRYYDYALSVFEINSVVYYGPNLTSASGNGSNYFDYLGQTWYSG
jgi:uncharacterized integral membrane protein